MRFVVVGGTTAATAAVDIKVSAGSRTEMATLHAAADAEARLPFVANVIAPVLMIKSPLVVFGLLTTAINGGCTCTHIFLLRNFVRISSF